MVTPLPIMMVLPIVGVIVWRLWMSGEQRKPSNGVDVMDIVDRAESYLRRIVAVTGATRVGSYYVLDVGKTRFEVHDSYVCQAPSAINPTATPRGTCFYLPNQHLPAEEKIATALLQLKNNPTLFDRWAGQTGVFKADGELFSQANTNPRRYLPLGFRPRN
jgi:hypothetical protein